MVLAPIGIGSLYIWKDIITYTSHILPLDDISREMSKSCCYNCCYNSLGAKLTCRADLSPSEKTLFGLLFFSLLKFFGIDLCIVFLRSCHTATGLRSGLYLDYSNSLTLLFFQPFCCRFAALLGVIVLLHDPVWV